MKRTLLQHGNAFLRLVHVTQLVRELRLADSQLRRSTPELPLMLRMTGRTFLELALALVEHSLSLLERSKARLQLGPRLGELAFLGLERGRARLDLGRPRLELPKRSALYPLLVLQRSKSRFEVGFLLGDDRGAALLSFECSRRGRDPLAAFLELGGENT